MQLKCQSSYSVPWGLAATAPWKGTIRNGKLNRVKKPAARGFCTESDIPPRMNVSMLASYTGKHAGERDQMLAWLDGHTSKMYKAKLFDDRTVYIYYYY